MPTKTAPPSGTATQTKPAQALTPALVRDFCALVSLMAEAGAVVLTAAEAAGRPDLVTVLLRGRQALAEMQRDLREGGPQW